MGVVEPSVASIRIDGWDEIEDDAVQEFGDFREASVLMAEVPGGVGGDFAALDFVAVDVSVDIHARFTSGVADIAGREFEAPEVASLDGAADGIEARDVWEFIGYDGPVTDGKIDG